MDQQAWNKILATIGAEKVEWKLPVPAVVERGRAFRDGGGLTFEQVKAQRSAWKSDKPFYDENGKPFVMYIYDQAVASARWGWREESTYKFHFCWCPTLAKMRSIGREPRYKAKHDISNNIFDVLMDGRVASRIKLSVCKNCLNEMSYRGYSFKANYGANSKIYEEFEIKKFFEEHGPQHLSPPTHQWHSGVYTDDWPEVSKRIKFERGGVCEGEDCFSTENLHVHHVNGVKSDNSPHNLVVLCRQCHSKQPLHGHMRNPSLFK